jgi:hypothetical protein
MEQHACEIQLAATDGGRKVAAVVTPVCAVLMFAQATRQTRQRHKSIVMQVRE